MMPSVPRTGIMHRTRAAVLRLAPAQIAQTRLHRRTLMQFSDAYGLVYFGYVDQRDDDHRLIRGLTVSPTSQDNHYCIGSYDGYDVLLVERRDTIHYPGKPARDQRWIIMEFDLRTTVELPHIFIGLHSHSDTFYAHVFTKFATMARVSLGRLGPYDPNFAARYSVYTPPAHAVTVERLFDDQTCQTIAKHFGSLTIEIHDNCLYLYSEHKRLSLTLLETMIKNAAWLAQRLDERALRL